MIFSGIVTGAMVGGGLAMLLVPGTTHALVRGRAGLVAGVRRFVAERALRAHANDLAVVGWTSLDVATRQLLGLTMGAIAAALLGAAYGAGPFILFLVGGGGAVGFLVPSITLRSRARARRRTFSHAFSAYLDLVNVLLAGGAGIETALTAAADVGDGWAFGALRATIGKSRLSGRSPWSELRKLGVRWGIDELVEVAGSMTLSSDHGARIRTSLAARAESMRDRQMAEVESLAQSATERMGVPMMMLFVGFMALLGYPALQTVVMNM